MPPPRKQCRASASPTRLVRSSSAGTACAACRESFLRVYMAQLRRKLEAGPAHPRYLITDAGMGYRFEPHRLVQHRRTRNHHGTRKARIYLGAAPGVGETYTMLSEAHRRVERGTNSVVGFVAHHKVVRRADQTELVDMPPQALRRRTAPGVAGRHRGVDHRGPAAGDGPGQCQTSRRRCRWWPSPVAYWNASSPTSMKTRSNPARRAGPSSSPPAACTPRNTSSNPSSSSAMPCAAPESGSVWPSHGFHRCDTGHPHRRGHPRRRPHHGPHPALHNHRTTGLTRRPRGCVTTRIRAKKAYPRP